MTTEGRASPAAATTFACPNCFCEQTQRLSIIFLSGTSVVQSKSTGMAVGLADGGLVPVLGGSSSTGVQRTQLAQQVAPPGRRAVARDVFMPVPVGGCLGLVLGIVASLVFSEGAFAPVLIGTYIVVQCGGLFSAVQGYRWNRDVWPGEYAAWERRWLCHRCAATFEPAGTAQIGGSPT